MTFSSSVSNLYSQSILRAISCRSGGGKMNRVFSVRVWHCNNRRKNIVMLRSKMGVHKKAAIQMQSGRRERMIFQLCRDLCRHFRSYLLLSMNMFTNDLDHQT